MELQASTRTDIQGEWPADALEQVASCPVCDQTKSTLLHPQLTDETFGCAPGSWSMYSCDSCASAFLNPRPTAASLHLAYRSYYTHVPSEAPEPNNLAQYVRRALGNGYRNWRYGSELEPSSRLGIVVASLLPRMRTKVDRELRYLPRVTPGARLLDVGFGSGGFLLTTQKAGWQVAGVDPDPVVVKDARKRGFDVREGSIDAFADQPESFDVITLSHVIEHVHDPRAVISAAYRLLRPGGMIWIETPNIESLGHARFGANWRGLEAPRHLVLFSWQALEATLHGAGFVRSQRRFIRNAYGSLSAASQTLKDRARRSNTKATSRLARFDINHVRARLTTHHTELIALSAIRPDYVRSRLSSTANLPR